MFKRIITFTLALALLLSIASNFTFKSSASSTVRIGHAYGDYDGKAGDSNKKEVLIENWSSGSGGVDKWQYVFRPKNPAVAEVIAKTMEQACSNNNIGYSRTNRLTLYSQAVKNNWNLSSITKKCDVDCSALVALCVIASGISIPKSMNTWGEQNVLESTGEFITYSAINYTQKSDYLKRGDILLYRYTENGHTAVVLDNGAKVGNPDISTLKISPNKNTYTITKGNSCSIGGTISSLYDLVEVKGQIDGKTYITLNTFNNPKKCNIGDTRGLNSFKGAELSAGDHSLKITAIDASGKVISKTIIIRVSTLRISPKSTGYTIRQGRSCSIGGTITSNYNLKSVVGMLDGKTYITITSFNDPKKCDINDTKGLNSFKAANLSVGTHLIHIIATDYSGKSANIKIRITVTASSSYLQSVLRYDSAYDS